MADNTTLNTMTGGDVIATDDLAGVKHQMIEVEARSSGSYYPNVPEPGYPVNDINVLGMNADGLIEGRFAVLSDEGSYYTSFPGVAVPAEFTTVTGTGQTVTVVDSECTIAAGTTANAEAYISLPLDYLPLRAGVRITISQRIANQDIYFELADGDVPANDTEFARFHWQGTTDTQTRCETQSSADTGGIEGDAENLTTTGSSLATTYEIELLPSGATFLYTDTVLKIRENEHPNLYTFLNLRVRVKNGAVAPASNTTIVIEWLDAQNMNRLDVGMTYHTESFLVGIAQGENTVKVGDGTDTLLVNADGSLSAKITDGTDALLINADGSINAVVTATNLDVRDLTHASDSVKVGDGTDTLLVNADGSINAVVAATVAHGGTDSGNPIKIGGRADTTFQTAVTDGQRVDALFDVYGVQRVRGDHPNRWQYHENSSSALTDTSVQAAPGAGFSVYITDIIFSTGAATAINIFLEEGTTTILGPYYLEAVAGRGLAIHFNTPHKCTANTAVTVTTSAAIAHGLDIKGFIAP